MSGLVARPENSTTPSASASGAAPSNRAAARRAEDDLHPVNVGQFFVRGDGVLCGTLGVLDDELQLTPVDAARRIDFVHGHLLGPHRHVAVGLARPGDGLHYADHERLIGHRRVRLPCLGSVRMTRPFPEGIPYEVTIRRRHGRWYAAVAYWKPPVDPPQRETQSAGGVDVGINPLAVDSGNTQYENPKGYYAAQKRLRRWQRVQARRTPGSRGWWEAQRRMDALHRRITGIRNHAQHQVSLALVRKYHTLGIESLNVAGMIRAGLQSKALSGAGISTLLHQIRYKAWWYGTAVVEAGRWYPSSKTCPVCGEYNAELGREKYWTCPGCGVIHDRNLNAARNLRKLALLAVGEDVMLLDGGALAGDRAVAGETAPDEGRTKPGTMENSQLSLAL